MTTFEESFVTEYQVAFNELIRLGQVAAEKNINGRESKKEDEIAQRLLICLKALSSPDLSTAQIEALEYCLRQLNHSLRVPTVTAIVDVEPVNESVVYRMPLWAGLFRAEMQNFSITKSYTMSFGNGSFSLGLQDIGFHRVQNMTFDYGSFILNRKNVDLSYIPYVAPTDFVLSLSLSEAVAGSPQWRAYFDATALNVTGNGDTDSGSLTYVGSVTATVYKITNSGITEDAGDVLFLVNGVLVDTQTFLNGDNLNGSGSNYKQYVFTGLSPADTLEVQITEG